MINPDLSGGPWLLVDMNLGTLLERSRIYQIELAFATEFETVYSDTAERVACGYGTRRDVPLLKAIGWNVREVDLPFVPAKPHTCFIKPPMPARHI